MALDGAQVIPNAAAELPEEEVWSADRAAPNRILFVGRFDRLKGGDTVIQAFGLLAQQNREIELSFAGPDRGLPNGKGGSRRIADYIAETVVDPAARRRIRVLGVVEQTRVRHLRRSSWLTIVASCCENFPNTVLEAMTQGVPLVSTNVGGIPEIVQHERNGLLAQARNAEDLANKIATLLQNPQFAAKLGEQARKDCLQRYAPDIIARRTVEFYRRVIDRWKNGRRKGERGRRL